MPTDNFKVHQLDLQSLKLGVESMNILLNHMKGHKNTFAESVHSDWGQQEFAKFVGKCVLLESFILFGIYEMANYFKKINQIVAGLKFAWFGILSRSSAHRSIGNGNAVKLRVTKKFQEKLDAIIMHKKQGRLFA